MLGEARIDASTFGDGDAGAITVGVDNLSLMDGAQIRSRSGGISRDTGDFIVGDGLGNDVIANVNDTITISGRGPTGIGSAVSTRTLGDGRGGDIVISPNRMEVTDGGFIEAQSLGNGLAGSIIVEKASEISLSDGSITTQATGSDGGNIEMNAKSLLRLVDSEITTSVESGVGGGGNISIDPEFVVLDSSEIRANAFGGPGGNINIIAGHFIASPNSIIDASSQLGIDGPVNIDAPDINIIGSLSQLPAKFSDATKFMPTPCAQRSGADVIQFVFRNYDVLPDSPYALRVPIGESVFTQSFQALMPVWDDELLNEEASNLMFGC